ncbi:hypothetical protein SAICODRAFT_32245 [Saitoella complicata NRRL Y-17804]|uniref:uncharacterized protein n=1 Tax=Saitoella complicata (strain BCRC 22490 / CBS 7301 / JCM 7358 / NBRC 10748 / NRRL Y-17804) TaxID=698492 RepID=UPI0008678AF9|nr:uncharacterized protein SAICODRAFT_32245 [Saitoella complicata NRRL Y-17804]ODQ49952.1 hypothetical protein SAICODRAFT_32245 [Saitoella complicata NRRL Y-17804]
MSTSNNDVQRRELKTLTTLRATLESIRLLTEGVAKDLGTGERNYEAVREVNERWAKVVEGAAAGK